MQERKERSADAQFIQIYETGAMLENIYANGASSGLRIVTTRRHVVPGGRRNQ